MCFFVAMPVADVFHKLFQYPSTATVRVTDKITCFVFCLPSINLVGDPSAFHFKPGDLFWEVNFCVVLTK